MNSEPQRQSTAAAAFSLVDGALADRLRQLELFSRLRVEGTLHGPNKSPFRGFSTDFLQHRQYFPGDNLKYLDWRVYGRSERLMVRQYEEVTNAPVRVVLDCSGSMLHQGESMSKWEFALRGAAILIYVAFLHRDAYCLTTFGDDRRLTVPLGSGRGHMLRCFQALLEQTAEGQTDFDQGMGRALGTHTRRGLTVVLSDFMDDPLSIAKRLSHLRFQNSDIIAMQVIEPTEKDLDFNSITRFHDLESGGIQIVDPQLIRRAYRETFAAHTLALKDACQRYGIQHVALEVEDRFEVPILEYLRWRMEVES